MSVSKVYTGAPCQSDAGAPDKLSDVSDTMTLPWKHRMRSLRHWDKSVRIIHAIDFLMLRTLYAGEYKHTSYLIDFFLSPSPIHLFPFPSSLLLETLYRSRVEPFTSHRQDNSLKTFISGGIAKSQCFLFNAGNSRTVPLNATCH